MQQVLHMELFKWFCNDSKVESLLNDKTKCKSMNKSMKNA